MTRSLLSPRTAAALAQTARDMVATQVVIADPAVTVTLERYDTNTTMWVSQPEQTVLVRWPNDPGMGNRRSGGSLVTPMASSPTPVIGTFIGDETFDVHTSDRFTLDGVSGHITTVYPLRFGARQAEFVVESDTR